MRVKLIKLQCKRSSQNVQKGFCSQREYRGNWRVNFSYLKESERLRRWDNKRLRWRFFTDIVERFYTRNSPQTISIVHHICIVVWKRLLLAVLIEEGASDTEKPGTEETALDRWIIDTKRRETINRIINKFIWRNYSIWNIQLNNVIMKHSSIYNTDYKSG